MQWDDVYRQKEKLEDMNEYKIITLREKAELKEAAAEWFHNVQNVYSQINSDDRYDSIVFISGR